MPFYDFEALEADYVTPKYSTAHGETITGDAIEVARLRFKAGEGAVEHSHPHEQVMYVITGRLEVELEGERARLGPGTAFHAPSNAPHKVTAVEDAEVLSCKNTIGGVGHKIAPGEKDHLEHLGKA